jgi:hypothetical protein
VVPRTPPEVFVTIPAVLNPENVMVPELVIPVAAAIAPEELTWNCEEDPTEKRDVGEAVAIPTFPFMKIAAYSVPAPEPAST